MQVAAPPISQQSPSAEEAIDISKLTQEERTKLQMSQWTLHSKEVSERRMEGERLKIERERAERDKLRKQWQEEQLRKQKDEERAKEGAAAMATHGGGAAYGGMGGAAPAKMDSRKRRAMDEGQDEYRPTFNGMSGGSMMAAHQNWHYMQQQQYQMAYPQQPAPPHPQMPQMMGQQQQQAPFHPLQGPSQMMQQPTADGGAYHPQYPACSTGPSTSTANGASSSTSSDGFPPSDPAPFATNHPSPAVVPSCSAGSSATPPQGQVPSEQIPTPPALNGVGNPPDDLANLNTVNTESMQQLVGSFDGPIADLGPDVFGDEYNQPSTSTGLSTQPLQTGTPSSVLSPDGFQMPVNGPHSVQSVHSHHNPMSNGNMLPPGTPTNHLQPQQPQMYAQQQPQGPQQIGAPLFTSTPKTSNPVMPPAMMAQMTAHSPMGAMGGGQPPPQMPSPLLQAQQQQAMQPLPSPSLQPMSAMAPQMAATMPPAMAQGYPGPQMHPMAAGYPGYPQDMMGAMPSMASRPMISAQHQQQQMAAAQQQQQQQYYAAMMQQRQHAAMMNPMQMQQHMQQMQMMHQHQQREMQRRMMIQQQQQQAAQMRYPPGMMDQHQQQQMMAAAAAAGRMPPTAAPMQSPSYPSYPHQMMYPQYPQMH